MRGELRKGRGSEHSQYNLLGSFSKINALLESKDISTSYDYIPRDRTSF